MAYVGSEEAWTGRAGMDVDEDRIDEAVLGLLWLRHCQLDRATSDAGMVFANESVDHRRRMP